MDASGGMFRVSFSTIHSSHLLLLLLLLFLPIYLYSLLLHAAIMALPRLSIQTQKISSKIQIKIFLKKEEKLSKPVS